MNHVIAKIHATVQSQGGSHERIEQTIQQRVSQFTQQFIFGIDLNPNLVKASKMNMVMNNDGRQSAPGQLPGNPVHLGDTELREHNLIGGVDLVFTNPPFGSQIPVMIRPFGSRYDLGPQLELRRGNGRWKRPRTFNGHRAEICLSNAACAS
jgi:type I restriction enzyme M protein